MSLIAFLTCQFTAQHGDSGAGFMMNIKNLKKKWTSMHTAQVNFSSGETLSSTSSKVCGEFAITLRELSTCDQPFDQPIFYVNRMTTSSLKVCSTKASEKTSDTSDECSSFRKYGGRLEKLFHHIFLWPLWHLTETAFTNSMWSLIQAATSQIVMKETPRKSPRIPPTSATIVDEGYRSSSFSTVVYLVWATIVKTK